MPIDNLPDYIRDGVKHGAENRVYIKADARAKCGAVKEVIDDVHSSGVEMIGFLADERKAPPLD
jgi:biopolymer transport protein ExbD